MFRLNAPVVIDVSTECSSRLTFALMTTGAFSRNIGKVIFRIQVGNR